jgi:hypothetical protein
MVPSLQPLPRRMGLDAGVMAMARSPVGLLGHAGDCCPLDRPVNYPVPDWVPPIVVDFEPTHRRMMFATGAAVPEGLDPFWIFTPAEIRRLPDGTLLQSIMPPFVWVVKGLYPLGPHEIDLADIAMKVDYSESPPPGFVVGSPVGCTESRLRIVSEVSL